MEQYRFLPAFQRKIELTSPRYIKTIATGEIPVVSIGFVDKLVTLQVIIQLLQF